MALAPDEIVDGKYRVVRLLGEGGMGAVYEGINLRIKRRVAIKTLHSGLASSADAVIRFEREAQAAGTIGNDHILEVLDLGMLADGDRYMVMEYLDGETLSRRIERFGRLLPHQVAPLIRQVLAGLHAAHAAGIVHRDLKPDNIFILQHKAGVTDFVKIIDFGISKFQPLSGDGMRMTRTGAVMGTPYYMSPEQANGSRETDARTDLYAVGVILYQCITGAVPFHATTFNQLVFKIVLEEPAHPATLVPELDQAFSSIALKAMARNPAQRFQTATEFVHALDEWANAGKAVAVAAAMPSRSLEDARASWAAVEPALRGSSAAVPVGPSTANSWAHSQVVAAQPRSRTGLVVGLTLGGLLLLVGGALAAYAWTAGQSQVAAADSATPAVLPAAQAAATQPVVTSTAQPAPLPAANASAKAPASAEGVSAPTAPAVRKPRSSSAAQEAAGKAQPSAAPAPKAPAPEDTFGY